MSDYPTFLQVGTEISAKFKGAFCEAKIKKASRCVKCRVVFKDIQIPSTVIEENVIRGSIRLGLCVEAPHPETKQMISATIQQIKDCSTYTVVFDDGDEKVLRRSQMCLKGGRHFDESESLDVMPLTKPEQFGAPVRSKVNKKLKHTSSDSDSDSSGPSSTAAEKKLFERRSTRQTPIHSSPTSSAANISSSSQADFGRVVCVFEDSQVSSSTGKNGSQEKRRWYPAMIVSPGAQQGTKLKAREEYLVRNFKDGKFQVVSRSAVQDFNIDKAKKNELVSLKPAIEKAILYLEEDELPVNWDRELLMGDAHLSRSDDSSTDDSASDERSDSAASSRPIVSEKKDRFVAQLYKYMDELGTPINKAPILAQKDLDLYRLFESVRKLGGYNRVCLKNEWKTVLKKLKLDGLPGATAQSVKSAFNKYLSQFESFYRKKGSQMDESNRRENQVSKKAIETKEEKKKRTPALKSSSTVPKVADKGAASSDNESLSGKQILSGFGSTFCESAEPEETTNSTEIPIKQETSEFKIGQKLRVQHGFGPQGKIYMAKVVKVEGADSYLVHYLGWNTRYDETITSARVVEVLPEEPSDGEGPEKVSSGPPRYKSSRGGHKPASSSRVVGPTERKLTSYARKRRSSGGSTHSLPLESCGKSSPLIKKINKKEKLLKKEPTDVETSSRDSPKSTRTNGSGSGRRSNNSTPVPPPALYPMVEDPKIGQQRRKAFRIEEKGTISDDESNDSEENTAAVRRVSKRLRGENPSESAPKHSSTAANPKEESTEVTVKMEDLETAPIKQSSIIDEEQVPEDNGFNDPPVSDVLPVLAESVECVAESSKIETINEIKLIEDSLIEDFTFLSNEIDIPDKFIPVTKDKQVCSSSATKRSTTAGSARKQKPKRRRRNYSHMVTEYRKSTKQTPKKDKEGDSDNEMSKLEGSPKDTSSLHALRQKVQQEMDSDPNYKPFYTFNVTDESLEGEKKIQVLQQRLLDLKDTYAQVKSEWTYLERKRKRHLEKKRKQTQRNNSSKRPSADSNEESRKISCESNEIFIKPESAAKT